MAGVVAHLPWLSVVLKDTGVGMGSKQGQCHSAQSMVE